MILQSDNPGDERQAVSADEKTPSVWFLSLALLFVTSLITANIVAVKLVDVGGLSVPAGTLTLFPLNYIIANIITEVYGFRHTRRIIWLGFGANIIAVAALVVTQYLPAAGFWEGQSAYEQILGAVPRILLASFVAYLFGEFVNATILAKLKVLTSGRWLWSRTITSSVVGQGLDSVIFVSIAFGGVLSSRDLLITMVSAWLVKSLYEVLATPLTYLLANFLKRTEGLDTFDETTSFSPFRFE